MNKDKKLNHDERRDIARALASDPTTERDREDELIEYNNRETFERTLFK